MSSVENAENTQKPPTPRKLFGERLEREGRKQEWFRRIKEIQQETGKDWKNSSWVAMREMGYKGPKDERAREAARLEEIELAAEERAKKRIEKENAIEGEVVRCFDEVLCGLPDKASDVENLAWVKAHPAMSRLDRQVDKTKPIIISADELLSPPHGPAPSKAAANALQHFANRPGEFYKQILQEQKKQGGGKETSAPEEQDINLDEVERMLKTVASRATV